MQIARANGKDYRLPGGMSRFQESLYIHLIDWKWAHITTEPGYSGAIAYDAILPDDYARHGIMPHLYPPILESLAAHLARNPFRIHKHFYHMASSQVANINMFLPLLHHPAAADVLRAIKPDFASLAVDVLDHGYCLEFWGGNFASNVAHRGPLGDKAGSHGTDCDIAIAYRNPANELCLWLIEHKLSEREFTVCSGPKSKNRDNRRHDCSRSYTEILQNKAACFHHEREKRHYWDITERNPGLFVGGAAHSECPFQGGMNQLWRNQLLAQALTAEQGGPYVDTAFSVLKHPANPHLDETLEAYKSLVADAGKFTVFNSDDVLRAVEALHDDALDKWARWYRGLYQL
ncbi:MAG: hypothetical protein IPM80_22105 [Proteobacteria bacterium]|nr:hypothetical protein [Pseudomonadota bacterium]